MVGPITALKVFDFDGDGQSEIVAAGKTGVALLRSLPDPVAAPPIANGDFSLGLSG